MVTDETCRLFLNNINSSKEMNYFNFTEENINKYYSHDFAVNYLTYYFKGTFFFENTNNLSIYSTVSVNK